MTDTLGPYELVRLIGKGGMGEVHLARDTRLDREVALKLLPPNLADDPDRRARFLREARAAAALNHPNITTIHDVGEEAGRDFIAQEFLQGRTLNEIIAERTLPLSELADIAVPLADALDYAHGRGVIHRDLKAANVIVTDRGIPKLLDFGLAKILRGEEPQVDDQSTTLTLSGAVFGTPGAMSPEQALGKVVDSRADVFSFGSLLYEMAAGKPAFLGTTVQETLDKVLHAEAEPLARVRKDLPSDFVAIVNKAMRKNPDERYQTMAELAADLRHFKRTTDSGVVPPVQAGSRAGAGMRAVRMTVLVLVVAVIAVLARDFLGFGGGDGSGDALPRLTNPRQVTFAVGFEDWPSWSAEGSLLAYQARAGSSTSEKIDIWVVQVGSGTPVNRTADLPGDCIMPSLSPDGTTIVFGVIEDLDGARRVAVGIYSMPVLGGPPRLVGPGALITAPLKWSTDGTRLAGLRASAEGDWSIRIAKSGGETVRDIPLPEDVLPFRADLAWSRDERLFAYTCTANAIGADTCRLWLLREADGAVFPLTDGRSLARSASFSPDGRALHYVSNQGGAMDLWRQALDEDGEPLGEPVALTAGLGIGHAAFSPDGSRLAYGKGGRIANIWRAPLDKDGLITWSDTRQITFDEAYVETASVSADGTWLAVGSDRAGNDDIWIMPSDGGQMRQLTTDPTPDWSPKWSPDGKQILFYAYRSGNRDVWLMPSAGGRPRQLTDHPDTDWFASWSPDGSRIAWSRFGANAPEMWMSALEPWEPRPVLRADQSPETMTFQLDGSLRPVLRADQSPETMTFQLGGSFWLDEDSLLVDLDGDFATVALDGKLVRRYEGSGPTANGMLRRGTRDLLFERDSQIAALDLDTGTLRMLTDFAGRPGFIDDVVGANEEFVWFAWSEERGDLWVMDVEGGSR